MEKLQQYDFKVIHHKDLSHKNADGLSRRLCAEINCQYCARVELKDTSKKENTIARIILWEENSEN